MLSFLNERQSDERQPFWEQLVPGLAQTQDGGPEADAAKTETRLGTVTKGDSAHLASGAALVYRRSVVRIRSKIKLQSEFEVPSRRCQRRDLAKIASERPGGRNSRG